MKKIIDKIILVGIHIDVFLLDKIFQRISNFFQKKTGLTCFFLAKTSVLVTWSTMVISIFAIPNINFLLRIFFTICSLIYLLIIWALISSWDEREEILAAKGNVMNPMAITGHPIRMMALSNVILVSLLMRGKGWQSYLVSSRYLKICFIFVMIYLYFASCTPLPPGKSRIRKWIEYLGNMFAKKSPVLCPAKESRGG
jgi:hypothetical protein